MKTEYFRSNANATAKSRSQEGAPMIEPCPVCTLVPCQCTVAMLKTRCVELSDECQRRLAADYNLSTTYATLKTRYDRLLAAANAVLIEADKQDGVESADFAVALNALEDATEDAEKGQDA